MHSHTIYFVHLNYLICMPTNSANANSRYGHSLSKNIEVVAKLGLVLRLWIMTYDHWKGILFSVLFKLGTIVTWWPLAASLGEEAVP